MPGLLEAQQRQRAATTDDAARPLEEFKGQPAALSPLRCTSEPEAMYPRTHCRPEEGFRMRVLAGIACISLTVNVLWCQDAFAECCGPGQTM